MEDVLRATMSPGQADAVAASLDFSSRIMMGQIDEIANLARTSRLMVRDEDEDDGYRRPTPDEIDAIESHTREIARILGHRSGSFGLGAAGFPLEGLRQYEVKKVIEKTLADRRDPTGRGVKHDGLSVRYTRDEEPSARMCPRGRA